MGSSTESDSGATHAYDLATKELLQRYGDSPASLTVHLYPTHFRFGHQPGLFLKDSPGWEFLACLRDQRMPEDLRDVLGGGGGSGSSQLGLGGRGGGGGGGDSVIPFYDGCLIVELHDHRKASASRTAAASSTRRPMYPARHLDQELHSAGSEQQDEPEDQITICRIVLWPQEGSLAAELARLTPNDPAAALALEGRILALTQPLCLVADPAVCQAANLAWSATLPRPALPPTEPKKRKADLDLLHEARERRMRIMDESYGRSFTPTCVCFSSCCLDIILRAKLMSGVPPAPPQILEIGHGSAAAREPFPRQLFSFARRCISCASNSASCCSVSSTSLTLSTSTGPDPLSAVVQRPCSSTSTAQQKRLQPQCDHSSPQVERAAQQVRFALVFGGRGLISGCVSGRPATRQQQEERDEPIHQEQAAAAVVEAEEGQRRRGQSAERRDARGHHRLRGLAFALKF